MRCTPREPFFHRFLRILGLGRRRCEDTWLPFDEPPPDSFVREPRRPRPLAPGGGVALELPPDLR